MVIESSLPPLLYIGCFFLNNRGGTPTLNGRSRYVCRIGDGRGGRRILTAHCRFGRRIGDGRGGKWADVGRDKPQPLLYSPNGCLLPAHLSPPYSRGCGLSLPTSPRATMPTPHAHLSTHVLTSHPTNFLPQWSLYRNVSRSFSLLGKGFEQLHRLIYGIFTIFTAIFTPLSFVFWH